MPANPAPPPATPEPCASADRRAGPAGCGTASRGFPRLPHHQPIFNVPGAVVGALAVIVAVHVGLDLLPEPDGEWWTLALAFIPARLTGQAASLPGGTLATFASFLTHMLVHGDATHLIVNGAWLLAFGGAVAHRIGGARFIAFGLVCGVAAALAFFGFNYGKVAPVVGASGAISGLMGGIFRFLFNAGRGASGLRRLQQAPKSIPTMPLMQALTDRRVLLAIAIWIGANFLALLGLGGVTSGGGIAWEAHIGGFLFGFLTFAAFEEKSASRGDGINA